MLLLWLTSTIVIATALHALRAKPLARHDPAAPNDARPSGLDLERRASAPQCPFCRQPIGSLRRAGAVRCASCDVLHHAECWSEHGGCSVLGCAREARSRRARGLLAPRPGGARAPAKA